MLKDSITYAKDQYEALNDADCLLVVTELPEFRSPNFDIVAKLLRNKAIFDGRNIYEVKEMQEKGFYYECIGINLSADKSPVLAFPQ